MTRLFCILLTLLFSLSGSAMGEYSDFGRWSNAANATARVETTALSTYRSTTAGETFIRYESANPAFSKFTANGGLAPGSYAAPMSDGFIPVADRIGFYNLPSSNIPRTSATIFSPPTGTTIIGPRPVIGGPGNEVIFPFGFKP
jgi:hypothetical protein